MKGLARLDGRSAPREVFDALRQFGPVAGYDDGEYPEDLQVSVSTRFDVFGPALEPIDVRTTAYVIAWSWFSIYYGRTVTTGNTLVDRVSSGLCPDGFVSVERYLAPCSESQEVVDALMLLAARAAFPKRMLSEDW